MLSAVLGVHMDTDFWVQEADLSVLIPLLLLAMAAVLLARRWLYGASVATPISYDPALSFQNKKTNRDGWMMIASDGTLRLSDQLRAWLGLVQLPTTLADLARLVPEGYEHWRAFDYWLNHEKDRMDFKLTSPFQRILLAERTLQDNGNQVIWLDDITESEQLTDQLRRQAKEFKKLLDAEQAALDKFSMPIWQYSDEGHILWANKAYIQAVDADNLEALSKNHTDLLDRSPEQIAEVLKTLLKGDNVQSEIVPVVMGGDRRQMQVFETAASNREGDKCFLYGLAFDLNEYASLATRLKETEISHRETLNALTSPVVIFGSDQRIQFYNHAFVELWSLDVSWLNAHPTHSELLDRLRNDRMLPEQVDFKSWKKDILKDYGTLVDSSVRLLYLPDESILKMTTSPYSGGGLIVVLVDVTDRVALENSYNTSLAVQRVTLNNLQEGVAMIGSDGRVILHNDNFAQFWQLNEADLEAHSRLVDSVDLNAETLASIDRPWSDQRNGLLAMLDSRETQSDVWRLKDKRTLQLVSVPLPDGANLLSVLDISDSANIEEALLERTHALEVADRIKSEFVTNVSYELRTPLNTIIGFTELLEKEYFGPVTDKQKEYLGSILQASGNLRDLINDILDLAVLEAGQLYLDISDFDVNHMLESVLQVAQDQARRASVHLLLDVAEGLGDMTGDQRRISHAIYNMIISAIDFTNPGGEIQLQVSGTADDLTIVVTDDSITIPQSSVNNLFNSFTNVVDSEGRRHKMGMGLSLVKSFIEVHGGHVEVISERGAGTAVKAQIPRKTSSQTADQTR